VKGIGEAIIKSKANVVYNCNLVNKKGHTERFSLEDYIDSINNYIGKERIDTVIFNNKKPDARLVKKYQEKKEMLVKIRDSEEEEKKYKVIETDVLNRNTPRYSKADVLAKRRAFIRHDSDKLAKVLMKIIKN